MLYSYLNCNKLSTEEEIRKNYKKISRIVHPDKSTRETLQGSEELFRKIENAYSVLSCPIKRHLYDCYSDEGIEVYEANKSLFQIVKTIKDQEKKFRKIEEIYLTLKNHKNNCGSLELLDSQELEVTLSMIEYSSIYKGKHPYNPFSMFSISKYHYHTAAVLGEFGKLGLVIGDKNSGLKFSSRSSMKMWDREIDFNLEVDVINFGNGSLEISQMINNW